VWYVSTALTKSWCTKSVYVSHAVRASGSRTDTPCDKYADADDAEDLVAPERVGDDGRSSEPLLPTNPEDEGWDEGNRGDEQTERYWFADFGRFF
jgi:hypothetical protein